MQVNAYSACKIAPCENGNNFALKKIICETCSCHFVSLFFSIFHCHKPQGISPFYFCIPFLLTLPPFFCLFSAVLLSFPPSLFLALTSTHPFPVALAQWHCNCLIKIPWTKQVDLPVEWRLKKGQLTSVTAGIDLGSGICVKFNQRTIVLNGPRAKTEWSEYTCWASDSEYDFGRNTQCIILTKTLASV